MAKVKRQYYATDVEKVKEAAEKLGSGLFWKSREGKNIIRVLPPFTKNGIYYVTNTLHNGFKIDGMNRALTCLAPFDQVCPVCAMITQLKEAGDKDDRKAANRISPRTKNYANILDRHTGAFKIWGFSVKILKVITGYITDPEWGDITDPETGHDLLVTREGEGINSRYEVRARLKAKPIGVEDWLEQAHNLRKECVKIQSYEELLEVVEDQFGKLDPQYLGEDEAEEEDDEESPKPKAKKAEKEEDDEEEEEEPKPKKKAKKPVDDDEEAPV